MSDRSSEPPPGADLEKFLAAAERAAAVAREVVVRTVREGFDHRLKPDRSFVTDVDLEVERALRDELLGAFPDHGFVGEELPASEAGSDLVWVVDPIDGTHSLRHGVPLYGTLIALLCHGQPVAGVVDLPGLDQRYAAARGLGAYRNGRHLHTRDLRRGTVEEEILAIGERKQFEKNGQTEIFDLLTRAHPSLRTYCDCFGHALAIEGAAGAMIDFGLRIWDVAASRVLTEEAGGKFVYLARPEDPAAAGPFDVVFGKPWVVDWVLETIEAR